MSKKGHCQSFAPFCLSTIISYKRAGNNAALSNKDNKINRLLTEVNKAPYYMTSSVSGQDEPNRAL